MSDDHPSGFSRRDLLKGASVAGAAVAASPAGVLARGQAEPSQIGAEAAGAQHRAVYEHFTAEEAELLEAIADHLIPADENGPGAIEARAVHYIDRSLGGHQRESREAYRSGLAALDRYCRLSRGARFLELEETDQISALIDLQTGSATGARAGFVGSSAAFFGMVRSHVLHGTFGDPFYGGNAGFVGWDLLGYPGVRVSVTPSDQERLEAGHLPVERRSAYDWESFNGAEDGPTTPGSEHDD